MTQEQPERQPSHLDLRASDAERERVAKILNDALAEGRITLAELDERLQKVYAAKTLGELVPLTQDLPMTAGHVIPAPAPAPPPVERIGGTPGGSAAFAMLGGFRRAGSWVVPAHYTAFAILGGGEIDLTQARFAEPECTIQVFTLMGGIEIVVPDDVTVRVTGVGIMGGFEHRNLDGPPGGPVLNVTGLAIMGGVEVRRTRPKDRKRLEREDRKHRELEDRDWRDDREDRHRDHWERHRERHERRWEARQERFERRFGDRDRD